MLTRFFRQAGAALRLLLAFIVVLGIGYPLLLAGVGRATGTGDGALLHNADGAVIGSQLLAQPFDGDQWFQPRPSASQWDALASAPSNLGPSNPQLLALIEERRSEVADREGVDPAEVPADAVTASASGLDPHISPEYAAIQIARVAQQNGLTVEQVQQLVAEHTQGRLLGFAGMPAVNVVTLNAALADLVAGT